MLSLPQLRRDVGEVEAQLRFARHRLGFYELVSEPELRAHVARVVAHLEQLRDTLASRLHQQLPTSPSQ